MNPPPWLMAAALTLVVPLNSIAAGVTLAITPGDVMLAPGAQTFVDVTGTYDGTDKLLGGAFSLSFRSDLLQVVGVTLQAPADVGGDAGTISLNGSDGVVSGIRFASFAGVGASFALARIEFKSLGPVGISPLYVYDAADPVYTWINEAIEPVGLTAASGLVTVSAVPELPAVAMMICGVALAGAIRKLR